MNFIQKLFKSRKVNEPMNSALNIPVVIPRLSSEWVRFEDEKPPHEVVLAACDTYDCVSAVDYYSNGMHYKVFNSASGDLFVVNITKDSIECYNNR